MLDKDKKLEIVLLDTKTNKKVKSVFEANLFWWSEGNGSCDCNRIIDFGDDIIKEHEE